MKKNLPILFLTLTLLVTGCTGKTQSSVYEQAKSQETCIIYCMDLDEQELSYLLSDISIEEDAEKGAEALLSELAKPDTTDAAIVSVLPANVKVEGSSFSEGILTIDFSEEYKKTEALEKAFLQAAYVLTLTQLKGVEGVSFAVAGETLQDESGEAIIYYADQFLDFGNYASGFGTDETVTLYFANANGDTLVSEEHTVTHEQNRLFVLTVIDALKDGPREEDRHATIPSSVDVIDAQVRDGVCYINFNEELTDEEMRISDQILIYSIVNTLTGLEGIDSVKLMINGDGNMLFHEIVDLSLPLKADPTLVEGYQEPKVTEEDTEEENAVETETALDRTNQTEE